MAPKGLGECGSPGAQATASPACRSHRNTSSPKATGQVPTCTVLPNDFILGDWFSGCLQQQSQAFLLVCVPAPAAGGGAALRGETERQEGAH